MCGWDSFTCGGSAGSITHFSQHLEGEGGGRGKNLNGFVKPTMYPISAFAVVQLLWKSPGHGWDWDCLRVSRSRRKNSTRLATHQDKMGAINLPSRRRCDGYFDGWSWSWRRGILVVFCQQQQQQQSPPDSTRETIYLIERIDYCEIMESYASLP